MNSEQIRSIFPGWTVTQFPTLEFPIAILKRYRAELGDQKVHYSVYEFPNEQGAINAVTPISRPLIAVDRLEQITPNTYPSLDNVMWFKSDQKYAFFLQKRCRLHYMLVYGPEAQETMLGLVTRL